MEVRPYIWYVIAKVNVLRVPMDPAWEMMAVRHLDYSFFKQKMVGVDA